MYGMACVVWHVWYGINPGFIYVLNVWYDILYRGEHLESGVAGAQHVLCVQWICGFGDGWGGGGHHLCWGLFWGNCPACPPPHP